MIVQSEIRVSTRGRGTYDLSCFLPQPDVQFVAVCDVKAARREAIKNTANQKYGNRDCATYRDLRDLLSDGFRHGDLLSSPQPLVARLKQSHRTDDLLPQL